MEQSITVDIDAPASRVWAILSDAERWPEWTETVRSVTLHDGVLRLGATATIDQPRLPTVRWTVTRFTEGHEFTWESGGPGARTVAHHRVEGTGPGRCRLRLSVSQSGVVGSLVGRLYRGLTDRYLAIEAAGLKARAESAG
ncbi:SRPBCC family protein [Terrabacter sp. GCM10028922]|uniref:SRPBCC family protein n=1 Tax=Terrabacter sp. GCM10028922 TaxID=3273428 RepID=UPI003619A104